jgi:hypothetical protein
MFGQAKPKKQKKHQKDSRHNLRFSGFENCFNAIYIKHPYRSIFSNGDRLIPIAA